MSEGEEVIPELNRWIEAAEARGAAVYASRDWHPPGHLSFLAQGGDWPPHCVQDTAGACYHPDLHLPGSAMRISKGVRLDRDQYSAFDATGATEHMRARGIERLWIGGLAQDVCVRATVLDACREGFEVHVLLAATRPVDAKAGADALREMRAAGATLVDAS